MGVYVTVRKIGHIATSAAKFLDRYQNQIKPFGTPSILDVRDLERCVQDGVMRHAPLQAKNTLSVIQDSSGLGPFRGTTAHVPAWGPCRGSCAKGPRQEQSRKFSP